MASKCNKVNFDDVKNKYHFPTEPIPRLNYDDPKVYQLVESGRPVVITGTKLLGPAYSWNLEFLADNIGSGLYTVYSSPNGKFKYYDDKKIPKNEEFKPPTSQKDVTFQEFVQLLREKKDDDSQSRIYLQQPLNDTVGPRIVRDFQNFNSRWATNLKDRCKWAELTSNLLLVGMEGVITPAHYDEQENLFAQVKGYKRFLLFEPTQFECLYPYPVYHPHDRQSQVDFEKPNFEKFPKFKDVKGMEAIVGPEDVLYIPIYWWHQVESLPGFGETISVTFWYKKSPTVKVVYPLSPSQRISIMRNVEKMVAEVLNDNKAMPSFMSDMVLGRYTDA